MISLTLSRYSIASTALSPVDRRISSRWDPSIGVSVTLLTSSPKSKSPFSGCLAFGRKSMMPDISGNDAEGKRIRVVDQEKWSCGGLLGVGGESIVRGVDGVTIHSRCGRGWDPDYE